MPSQFTLLDYIRGQGLTGAKEGCAEGECGACAVLFVNSTNRGTVYQSVNSCLVPLPAAAGHEVYTVEALAETAALAEVQQAMAERGGSQCGYCTPGFIVSMFAEQFRPHHHRSGFDPDALGGNLCRCTGYRPIRDAMQSLGPPADTPLRRRLESPAPQVLPIDYETPQGRFSRPCSLAECLKLAARSSGRAIRRGQYRPRRDDQPAPSALSPPDQSRWQSPNCASFRDAPDMVEIGAGLTLTEIEERWTEAPGPVSRLASFIRLAADSQSRHPRRQSRHSLADRRLGAPAAGPRRGAADRRRERRPNRPAPFILPRLPPDISGTRRDPPIGAHSETAALSRPFLQSRQTQSRRHQYRRRRYRDHTDDSGRIHTRASPSVALGPLPSALSKPKKRSSPMIWNAPKPFSAARSNR